MKNLRISIWLPTALGIVLATLSLVSSISRGMSIELAVLPQLVVDGYRDFIALLSLYALELPFGLHLPLLGQEIAVLWLAVGGSNLRAVSISGQVWRMVNLRTYDVIFRDGNSWDLKKWRRRVTKFLTVIWLLVGGPVATLIFLAEAHKEARWLRSDAAERFFQDLPWDDDPKEWARDTTRAFWLTVFVIALNFVAAALFFLWNASELQDLSFGMKSTALSL